MSKRQPVNVAASVRARLLHRAKESGGDYNALLVRYVIERFLYRLGRSASRDRFVLKGAMLFVLWEGNLHRMTRDLDLLGRGHSDEENLLSAIRQICELPVEDDGIVFAGDLATAESIRENQTYEGVRIRIPATLASARISLQIDIGFGDIVSPVAEEAELPTILDAPPPRLHVYPRETVVAEKTQAMVVLGAVNTRLKDFYDIAYLAQHFNFSGSILVEAIDATFTRRRTRLSSNLPLALTEEFARDPARKAQWRAFVSRARLAEGGLYSTSDFEEVVSDLRVFLGPPLEAIHRGTTFGAKWIAPGPWT